MDLEKGSVTRRTQGKQDVPHPSGLHPACRGQDQPKMVPSNPPLVVPFGNWARVWLDAVSLTGLQHTM